MSVMSIRVDEKRKRQLKILATIEGKTIGGLMEEMIDERLKKSKKLIENNHSDMNIAVLSGLSEKAFNEWDNTEDEVYNDL